MCDREDAAASLSPNGGGPVGGHGAGGVEASDDTHRWRATRPARSAPNHYVEYNNDIIAVLDRATLK
jgi:hypothetical protein